MVRTGQVAFAKTPMGNLTAYDKRLGVLGLPYAFGGEQQCLSMLDGELGRRCTSILSESGLAVLAYFYGGDRNFYNAKRPIHEPADLKGLRIRVPQDIVSIDMINAMGGSAVPMATNDLLSALQQHVVDGAEDSAVFYVTERNVQRARYYSRSRHQQSIDVLIGSWKWLSEQPQDMQDAILVAGRHTQAEEIRLWGEASATALAGAKSQGALVNDVDIAAFQQAVASVVDEHRGTFGDLAALLPGG
jgi:TRAP-type C4-dicarboxylate transport system substrate-binding protein